MERLTPEGGRNFWDSIWTGPRLPFPSSGKLAGIVTPILLTLTETGPSSAEKEAPSISFILRSSNPTPIVVDSIETGPRLILVGRVIDSVELPLKKNPSLLEMPIPRSLVDLTLIPERIFCRKPSPSFPGLIAIVNSLISNSVTNSSSPSCRATQNFSLTSFSARWEVSIVPKI